MIALSNSTNDSHLSSTNSREFEFDAISSYAVANRPTAIIPTPLRHSLEGTVTRTIMTNFKKLTLTLNLTLIEKWNAIPNPNPIPLAQFYECSVLSQTPLFTEQKRT